MKYFGTDGIRGTAGEGWITEHFFRHLMGVLEKFFKAKKIAIGRDTRWSGRPLKDACVTGVSPAVEVMDGGVMPTPALAYMTSVLRADFGVMLTASHNPYTDNGIKIFSSTGEKLSVTQEKEIENRIENTSDTDIFFAPHTQDVHESFLKDYIQKCTECFRGKVDRSVKIALDSANGATCSAARRVFEAVGAEVTQIHHQPDGKNINDACGSEHPESLQELMKSGKYDMGIAHDGDGDRAVILDEAGRMINGNILLGAIASALHSQGRLPNDTLVTTVQSNLGLDIFLEDQGIHVVRSDIGDRNVYQMMKDAGSFFGGESSGHCIFREISPTGDGIITGLMALHMMLEQPYPLSQWHRLFPLFPQVTSCIKVAQKVPLEDLDDLAGKIEALKQSAPCAGRILVRYSGTEPKLRILVEYEEEEVAQNIHRSLILLLKQSFIDNKIAITL